MIPLEVPVFSPPSAAAAVLAGAHRLELNRAGSYPQGGLTPTVADLEEVLALLRAGGGGAGDTVPLRIMIRPRGPPADGSSADFVYSGGELAEMGAAVRAFAASGLMRLERGDGFVFGVLREEEAKEEDEDEDEDEAGGRKAAVVVDVQRNRELVGLAAPWPCVFHRAFDDVLGSGGATPRRALADLEACGFRGLLTSGGPGAAADNAGALGEIVRAAPAGLGEVIVGGGVRSPGARGMAEAVLAAAGGEGEGKGEEARPRVAVWFHSSCLTGAGEGDVVDEAELRAIVDGLGGGRGGGGGSGGR